jgi:hypothetical protein
VALEQPWAFVELVLLQALRLVRKPRKRSRLEDCPGTIPAISLEARSVNHAYSLISEAYEGWRRSHTGNVFREVFFQSSDPDGLPWWRPLGDLRADD